MRIALVTGAGSGVGRYAALALINVGYCVALAGRRRETLEETVALCDDAAETLVVPTDVSDELAVKQLYASIEKQWGRLDVLFNNAGVNTAAIPLDELALDDWRRVVDTNLTGMFLCVREAFRLMKRQEPKGGRIINNGSISAHVPRPHSVAYTATKHAVTGLTKSASLDGRTHAIACGQIDIGNAATDMTARMEVGVPQANGTLAIEPTMDVRHVADAVVYMAGLPLDTNVPFITVMANEMPYMGRG
ncbi:MAG: SDR family oxidoreductase [Pirellulaceae bacterium]|jgi:NAD(P)-dependent dehydrogenase (short-subunit alcohol dehydrogenase family)